MAYSEELADRVRAVFAGRPEVREQKMFGGLAFILRGNMACGVLGCELVVRVGRENLDEALAQPYSRPFDMTGRPMRSFVYVASEGIATDADLEGWAGQGMAYAASLPPKQRHIRASHTDTTG